MLSRDGTTFLCGACRFYKPVVDPIGHGQCIAHPKQVVCYVARGVSGQPEVMTQMVRPIVSGSDPTDACGLWEANVRRPPADVVLKPDPSRN